MLTAFMVTILLLHTSAGDGIAETHHQYHDMTDCRWGVINQMRHTQLPPHVEVLKQYCQMEAYGPNYRVVQYPDGDREVQIIDRKIWSGYPE